MSDFTKEELALGARMFDSQPDSPWTAFCELCELFGSMSLERRQELYDIVAKQRAAQPHATPLQRGFRYEVSLYVSIPLAWATLLKASSKHHYDLRCNEAGHHGVINGLFNTACDSEYPSIYPVTWSDLDLTTKVAEQLEYHTSDHELVRAIRAWLRATMDAIAHQRNACMELPGSNRPSDNEDPA